MQTRAAFTPNTPSLSKQRETAICAKGFDSGYQGSPEDPQNLSGYQGFNEELQSSSKYQGLPANIPSKDDTGMHQGFPPDLPGIQDKSRYQGFSQQLQDRLIYPDFSMPEKLNDKHKDAMQFESLLDRESILPLDAATGHDHGDLNESPEGELPSELRRKYRDFLRNHNSLLQSQDMPQDNVGCHDSFQYKGNYEEAPENIEQYSHLFDRKKECHCQPDNEEIFQTPSQNLQLQYQIQ